MSDRHSHLDEAFIAAKRHELIALRDALRTSAAAAEAEESGVKDAAAAQPHEYQEDAQNLDTLENDGLLVSRSVERLALIERALAKIDDGTYGLSDLSGDPIPAERLNAVPEAVNTKAEQEARERVG